jgi:hypothetical protein
MSDERVPWIVLGREIGTGTGWDGELDSFTIYNFKPEHEVKLPEGDLHIDFIKGLFLQYTDDGEETFQADMIEILMTLPNTSEG